jgi:hypothetical protein
LTWPICAFCVTIIGFAILKIFWGWLVHEIGCWVVYEHLGMLGLRADENRLPFVPL